MIRKGYFNCRGCFAKQVLKDTLYYKSKASLSQRQSIPCIQVVLYVKWKALYKFETNPNYPDREKTSPIKERRERSGIEYFTGHRCRPNSQTHRD